MQQLSPDATAEERHEHARQLLADGEAALGAERYEEAVRLLESSYATEANAEVLLPLARALAATGNHAGAAERLRRYIDEMSDELDERGRMELERELGELTARYARVTIDTDPQGAVVLMGERTLGTTPLRAPLHLVSGRYHLEARLEGYRDAMREIEVLGGHPLDVTIEMEPVGEGHPGGTTPPRRGLTAAFWTTLGLTLVSATSMIVAFAVMGQREDEYLGAIDPELELYERVRSWSRAGFGLLGVSTTLAASTLSIEIVRLLKGRDEASTGDE